MIDDARNQPKVRPSELLERFMAWAGGRREFRLACTKCPPLLKPVVEQLEDAGERPAR